MKQHLARRGSSEGSFQHWSYWIGVEIAQTYGLELRAKKLGNSEPIFTFQGSTFFRK